MLSDACIHGLGALPDHRQRVWIERCRIVGLLAFDGGAAQRLDQIVAQLAAEPVRVVGSCMHHELDVGGTGGGACDETAAAGAAFDQALLG